MFSATPILLVTRLEELLSAHAKFSLFLVYLTREKIEENPKALPLSTAFQTTTVDMQKNGEAVEIERVVSRSREPGGSLVTKTLLDIGVSISIWWQ